MAVSLLIKPASDGCNMRCSYCFYDDVTANRALAHRKLMSHETAEQCITKALASAKRMVSFAFQGGEPTLAGLAFFAFFTETVKKHNTKNRTIQYAIQTNGYAIDEEWAVFFGKHQFLVGLSLDGTKPVHDSHRADHAGQGTFNKVLEAAHLLEKHKVEFNILTVVTAQTVRNVGKIYNFFKKNKFYYQQYIPCLDPLGAELGVHPYSLTCEKYTEFLQTLFNLWYNDFIRGTRISIRYFDNLLLLLKGYPPESCDQRGQCSIQHVIEADGSLYPCDFYALDEYYMGNIRDVSLTEARASEGAQCFLQQGSTFPVECAACQWFPLCRSGCRRNYEPFADKNDPHNYYCNTYQEFFAFAYPRLQEIANSL